MAGASGKRRWWLYAAAAAAQIELAQAVDRCEVDAAVVEERRGGDRIDAGGVGECGHGACDPADEVSTVILGALPLAAACHHDRSWCIRNPPPRTPDGAGDWQFW